MELTPETITLALAAILSLGVFAQWLAWRVGLPSIVLLLLFGFLVGPGAREAFSGVGLHPEHLFGALLSPLVSVSVGVILYEGGLTLNLREIKDTAPAIRNLVSIGALVTWVLAALAARFLLGFSWQVAVLLGAILVVTGPTVVGPLLRQVRPRGAVASALKWEGIVIDPIGATLAVLAFQVLHLDQPTASAVWGFLLTALVGLVLGFAGAALLVLALRKHLLPDALQNPASLALLVLVFALSDMLHEEAGLLAATVMGFALANQKYVAIRHLVEFKETLRVLLISGLFIVLAATLEARHLAEVLDPWTLAFLAALILVIRPASVLLSTWGSKLNVRERVFISCLAPRGIVAAAVASEFSLRLASGPTPHPDADRLIAVTFVVIMATVSIYGLTAGPLAYRLGLAQKDPQGLLVVGAHPFARELGLSLQAEGVNVLMVDNNRGHVASARLAGLPAVHANILSEYVLTELNLGGIGRLLAVTPNDEVNTLAAERFIEVFGSTEIFQLPPKTAGKGRHEAAHHHRTRYLFGDDQTFEALRNRFEAGEVIKRNKITAEFTFEDFRRIYGQTATPLFLIGPEGRVRVFASDNRPTPTTGHVLISLVKPDVDTSKTPRGQKKKNGESQRTTASRRVPRADGSVPTAPESLSAAQEPEQVTPPQAAVPPETEEAAVRAERLRNPAQGEGLSTDPGPPDEPDEQGERSA